VFPLLLDVPPAPVFELVPVELMPRVVLALPDADEPPVVATAPVVTAAPVADEPLLEFVVPAPALEGAGLDSPSFSEQASARDNPTNTNGDRERRRKSRHMSVFLFAEGGVQ
jgi:hypothetical protein